MHCQRFLVIATLFAAACTPAAETPPDASPKLALTLTGAPPQVQVRKGDTLVLDGLSGTDIGHAAFAFRHADASYDMKFGSFRILEDNPPPWQVATSASATAKGVDLAGSGGVLGSATLTAVGEGEVLLEVQAKDPAVNRVSMALRCHEGEHFLGLGGQSFDVDHRGQTVPLWVQEDGIGKTATDDDGGDWFLVGRRHNTHTPMPIYLSSRNYALLLESDHRVVFSLCSETQDAVRLENWEGRLKLRVFRGKDLADTLRLLTARLGRPEVPPAFAFAPWIDALYGSANVRRVAQKLRQLHIPVSVVWTEDQRGGTTKGDEYTLDEDWNVDRKLYPDFEALAKDLHGLGFKFLTYQNTFLTSDADVYPEAVAKGYAIQKVDGTPYTFAGGKFLPASLLDLSHPDARNWAAGIWKNAIVEGADGWMGDFCEWLPTDAVLHSGESGLDAHQRYAVDCQRLHNEVLQSVKDGVERLVFVRSAWLGSQPLVQVMWAGDQQTDFSVGDGLPSVIPMGIGLGITGFPYYAHDIAGYQSAGTEPATKELWFRWCSLGALSPVMRTHHGRSAHANWHWEKDQETTDHFAKMARLHMRLLPYLLGLAHEAHATGLPMMRPLALRWPEFTPGWTSTDQYLLGDRIVVAPVVTGGQVSRQVHLPPGLFYPLLGGTALQGGQPVTVQAALTEIPAFVPAGTLLPLLPEGVDTAVAATPAEIKTLAQAGDDRELWLWGGGHSAFAEPGGLNYDWQAAAWTGPAKVATWNGKAVAVVDGTVTVTGAGKLVLDGKATLTVGGGKAGRVVVVRWR